MTEPSTELLEAIQKKLAELLEIDEAGWPGAASWLDRLALEQGIDLYACYDNPRAWANSVLDTLRPYIDPQRFPNGAGSVNHFDVAEELFWTVLPDWRRTGL